MKLIDYIKSNKSTQAEFGKRIGKAQTTVSAYITGELIPPRATALKIVKVTKGAVTLEDLWGVKIA